MLVVEVSDVDGGAGGGVTGPWGDEQVVVKRVFVTSRVTGLVIAEVTEVIMGVPGNWVSGPSQFETRVGGGAPRMVDTDSVATALHVEVDAVEFVLQDVVVKTAVTRIGGPNVVVGTTVSSTVCPISWTTVVCTGMVWQMVAMAAGEGEGTASGGQKGQKASGRVEERKREKALLPV